MRNKKFRSIICIILAALMLLSVVLSALGSIGALAVSQSEIDALEAQKKELAEQKAAASSQIADLEGQQAAVIEKKGALDEQNELARQEIELIDEQIEIYDGLIEEKEEELEEALEQEEYQKERFRARIRAMQENGAIGYVAFILEAESFSDLLTRVDNITEIMQSDKALEEEYIEAREQVETIKAEYEEVQVEQMAAKEELEENKAKLEKEIESATDMIADLEEDIEKYTEEYAANESAEYALQLEIQKKTEEFNAQQQAQKEQGQTVVTGSGTFAWPTPGSTYISSGFGWRIHPIFKTEKYHGGIDVAANSGTPIQAIDSGTVQTAVYSSSYGNYVVINHGNGYTSTYAHQSSMAVSAGQTVTKGQVIGYVGSTGWSTGPHLHFEISYNGARVDPAQYYSGLTIGY